jgi:hypothetical protein
MPLHIFLGDEVPLYFIERVEVIEVQICLKFKLVCNLQKGLKFYKGFSIFLTRIGSNPGLGPVGLLPSADPTAQLASAAVLAALLGEPRPVMLAQPV